MGRKLVHELRGNRVILAGVALGVCFILVFYPLSVPGLSFSCSPWVDRSSGRVRKSHLLTPSGGRWEGLAHCHFALCCLSRPQPVQGQRGVIRLQGRWAEEGPWDGWIQTVAEVAMCSWKWARGDISGMLWSLEKYLNPSWPDMYFWPVDRPGKARVSSIKNLLLRTLVNHCLRSSSCFLMIVSFLRYRNI